jgi:hypothetical protein
VLLSDKVKAANGGAPIRLTLGQDPVMSRAGLGGGQKLVGFILGSPRARSTRCARSTGSWDAR